MRVSHAPIPTQNWLLVGLDPWQECLIQQQVQYFRERGAFSRTEKIPPPEVRWESHAPWPEATSFEEADLAIVSRGAWLLKSNSPSSAPENIEDLFPRDNPPIFLLWDWSPSGRIALRWALERGFRGVIHNPLTLRSWIQQGMTKLKTHYRVNHPILSKIALPSDRGSLP